MCVRINYVLYVFINCDKMILRDRRMSLSFLVRQVDWWLCLCGVWTRSNWAAYDYTVSIRMVKSGLLINSNYLKISNYVIRRRKPTTDFCDLWHGWSLFHGKKPFLGSSVCGCVCVCVNKTVVNLVFESCM